jgi:thioredoxin reductase (NADPH)
MKDYRESIAFPVLGARDLERLRKIGTDCEFGDGEVLFAEGDRGFDFFVVEEGQIEILEHSAGSATTVTVHEVGEFTGDVDMLTGRSSLVTARARGASRVIRIPAADVKKIVADEPELGNVILRGFLTRRALLLDHGFTGLRIFGSRFSRDTVRLAQFASRNGIPHTCIDIEDDAAAAEILAQLGVSVEEVPVVITGRGEVLRRPTIAELADTMGLATPARRSEMTDLLIVGAGPAGLAAAVYGASEGLRTVVLEADHIGGQAGGSTRIENYLGFPTGISGAELTDRAQLQAQRFGAEISVPVRVVGLELEPGRKSVVLEDGTRMDARSLIVATGADYRRPEIPRLAELEGVGVFYAASEMEARICSGSQAVIVGGGNSAGQAAVFLAARLSRVLIVIRGDDLRKSMSRYLVDRIDQTENIEVRTDSNVVRLGGEQALESVTMRDRRTGEETTERAAGLFLFIGAVPRTEWLAGRIETDEKGFLLTGSQLTAGRAKPPEAFQSLGRPPHLLETSVPGVFAVGDVRSRSVKRVASAVGEGSMAVSFVHQYLARG